MSLEKKFQITDFKGVQGPAGALYPGEDRGGCLTFSLLGATRSKQSP